MITLRRRGGALSSRCKTFTLGTYVRIECEDDPDFFAVLDMARDRLAGASTAAECTVWRGMSYVIKCEDDGWRLDVLQPVGRLPDHGGCTYCASHAADHAADHAAGARARRCRLAGAKAA